jgi:hypothetical protein
MTGSLTAVDAGLDRCELVAVEGKTLVAHLHAQRKRTSGLEMAPQLVEPCEGTFSRIDPALTAVKCRNPGGNW